MNVHLLPQITEHNKDKYNLQMEIKVLTLG